MNVAWRACLAFAYLWVAAICGAEPPQGERQIERALIERDRQAAEFSRPELRNAPPSAPEPRKLRPDERAVRQRDRDAYLLDVSPPPVAPPSSPPLSLPGGPGHAVDPVPVAGPHG